MQKKEVKNLFDQIIQSLPELKDEIDGAKNDLKIARTQKTQLETIVKASEDLLESLNDPISGVNAILANSAEYINTINTNKTESQELLTNIQTSLDSTASRITEMETAYTSFITTKEKIEDPTSGLLATLELAKGIRIQSQSTLTRINNLVTESDKCLVQLKEYISLIDAAYIEFQTSKKKVDDPINGLEAILTATQELRNNIAAVAETSNTHFAQIIKYKDEAATNFASLKSNKEASDNTLSSIKEVEAESYQTKDKISKIFEIVSQGGHAHYFNGRRKSIFKVAAMWLILGIISLGLAIYFGHEIIGYILKDSSQFTTAIPKLFVVTPLVVFTFYSLRNYGRERNLLEQYAFKEVSASTIEGSIALVQRATKGAKELDDKLLDVAISVVRDLHSEPLELRRSSRFSLKTNNNFMGITGTLEDNAPNMAEK